MSIALARARFGSPRPSGVLPTTPMQYFMVTATERSTFEGNMPTSAQIQSAFAVVPPEAIYGQWIGPGPRITRAAQIPAFITTARQPYAFPASLSSSDLTIFQNWLTAHLNENLYAVSSDFSRVALTAYNPAIDGALALWDNGTAQATTTRDMPQTGLERLAVPENPAGPVPLATPGRDAVSGAVRGLVIVAGLGVAALLLVEAGPILARSVGAAR